MAKKAPFSYYMEIILPLVGIGLMVLYTLCDQACSFLRGSLFGIDLKYVGVVFMVLLFILALPVIPPSLQVAGRHLRTMLLSGALGGEVILVRFQIVKGVFCPFCLAFAFCLLVLFSLRVKEMNRYLAVVSFLAGIMVFALFFRGLVVPLYSLLSGQFPLTWTL